MTNDMKPPPQNIVQPPEQTPITTKVAAEVESGHEIVSSSTRSIRKFSRNYDLMHIVLRLVCFSASLVSVVVMVTAKEKSTISIYGFDLPLYSKWSFSGSFEYLVAASSVVAAHSLVQSVMTTSKTLRKSSVFSSRNHAWLIFACDQVFAYLMISAGSASTGVANLNRTGVKHASLPNFCKPLHRFCDRVAISIAFAFFNGFLLAILAVLDVMWLSN